MDAKSCVHLSVSMHISKTSCLDLTKLMYMLSVVVAWSLSDNSAVHYVLLVISI